MDRSRNHAPRTMSLGRSAGKAVVAGLLCATLTPAPELMAAQPVISHRSAGAVHVSPKLTRQQRTLHALNRLTFGPRPGDAATVDRMGLEVWFQLQMHPERIPDGALETRLAHFPAMKLSQTALVERFPTPEMLRRYSSGGLAVPDDAVEQAIYADASLNYEEKAANRKAALAKASGAEAGPGMVAVQNGGAAPIARLPGGTAAAANGTMAQGDGNDQPVPMAPAAKDALLKLPPEARMQRLVAMTPDAMQSLQAALKGPEQESLYAGMTPEQTELAAAMKSPERLIGAEALSVRLLRDVYSQRQVQAVMTDFWLNHFSVYLHKNQNEPYLLPAYEREAVLPNALGRFEDLLVATAESPAMLVYLDNWESVGPNSKAARRAQNARPNPLAKKAAQTPQGINENYARELMELHTLGVKGGYTQQDVIAVAKCFTGWTIDRPANGGEFLFNPNRHEPGDKIVLGHVIHEDGMNEGLQVLHILATSPSTAHFVSLKLAERFVSDAPPSTLVDRMAKTFLKSDGDIRAVLTTMFHSPEFWSPEVYRAKVKTPVEFVASALRASDADVANPLPLVQALDRLGMPVYGMQTPNGYSWQAADWVSSNALLTRMNFALVLSGNRLGGTKLQWPALLGAGLDSNSLPEAVTEQRLEMALLGEPASEKTREAAMAGGVMPGVQQQAEQSFRATPVSSMKPASPGAVQDGSGGMLRVKAGRAPAVNTPETPLATTAGLLLGSPDFQRR